MNDPRGLFRRAVDRFVQGACLVTACAAGACAADPKQMMPGDGGGGAGAGLDCTMNVSRNDNTISDFESGTGAVLPSGGRNGAWYAYNDQTATCVEDPPPGAMNTPAARLDSPRCGSVYALRMKGTGCGTWGAGIGTDLAAPLPPDGGATDGGAPVGVVAVKHPYDLRGYRAISFWGRVGAGSTTAVRIKLPMGIDTKVADGGRCQLSEVGTDKCSNDWGRQLTFTAEWKMFSVALTNDPISGLSTETWGKQFPLDLSDVVAIQFQVGTASAFDVWIDDVNLTPP
jgi:hypothetical protein